MIVRRAKVSSESGFTMIELIAVSLLLMIMSGILYSTLNSFIRGKNVVLESRHAQRTAMHFFNRLNTELLNLAEQRLSDSVLKNSSSSASSRSRQRYVLGIADSSPSGSADSIWFVTEGAAQEMLGGTGNRGTVEVNYRLTSDKLGSNHKTPDGKQLYSLVREERPAGVYDDDYAKKKSIVFPISESISALKFRYLSKGEWYPAWGDRRVNFPDAIEATLSVWGERAGIETFRTIFRTGYRKFSLSSQSQGSDPSTPP